ncbi:hypothetical protein L596_011654 [Steinernema carpocapsae]|uniref:Uncharacterized protein n=1 Tax=Steinernema carpocapsae TaxID=34508 RepID=A0A4U5NUL3_STECR|nr:hypothetical protein L596_011654 [Steinernema carpocapsae]
MPAKNKPLTQKTSVPESSVNRVQKRTHSQSCTNENRSQKKFEIDDEEAEIKQQCLSKNAVLKLSEDLQLSSFKSIDTKSKMK